MWIPRGTTLQVRVETDRGKPRVAEVLEVDASTACPGENAPILRKRLGHDNLAEHRTPNAPAEGAFLRQDRNRISSSLIGMRGYRGA